MREQKKCKNTNEKGITLIALIISIIVMLILAGVSINAIVGDNGIITQAINAKTQAELASEKEEISYIVIEGYSGETTTGTALYDKNLSNNKIWNIVVINDTQEVYGTGWYYIEAGTDIGDYGETKYGWLVNYETGKIVQLEEDNYTQLDYTSSLAVTDNLILNIDSGIIEDSDDDSLTTAEQMAYVEEQLGDNITLVGFDEEDWGEASGITSTSFNFDGVDDYIQIQYDDEEEKEVLAENGFTFEFYGILNIGNNYDRYGNILDKEETTTAGLFRFYSSVNGNGYNEFRFLVHYNALNETNSFAWNAGQHSFLSDFSSDSVSLWNQIYSDVFSENTVAFYSVTLDCSEVYKTDNEGIEYYKQTFYKDGNKIYEGGFVKEAWEEFVLDELQDYDLCEIGRVRSGGWLQINYIQANAYTLRLYAKGLTEEEVLENYNTSVAYHTLLEGSN